MKFESKNVKKVVFVVALTSLTLTHAKMAVAIKPATVALVNSAQKAKPSQAALKKLAACIKAAKGKTTLLKELVDNQYNKIANAFKNVKSKVGALLAYKKLDAENKKLVDEALATDGVKDHLMSIITKA